MLLMDSQQWDRAVDEIGPRLYRFFKYKGAADLAADLTQETFVRLIVSIQKYDESRGPLVAFALGFAQNLWRERLRKMRVTESIDDHENLVVDTDLHAELESADQSEKLKAIVRKLPQTQQDILYFYFDEENTTREIAEILAMPEGTVKSHLYRAKETIRGILEKESI